MNEAKDIYDYFLSTSETAGYSKDFDVIRDIGWRYNNLIEEKFLLIDALKYKSLYPEQRANLRVQVAEVHHHLLRLDNIRGCIAFGWRYEVIGELAINISEEIATELRTAFIADRKKYLIEIDALHDEVVDRGVKLQRYIQKLSDANRVLRKNHLAPIMSKQELIEEPIK